jgi:ATP-binding cassette subfamily F protein 3
VLTAANILVQFGDRTLLDRVDMVVKLRDKVGLVGRNGAGKSTFLKILAGEKTPNDGSITKPGGSTLAFLHQEIEIDQSTTVLEEALTAFAQLQQLNEEIDRLNKEISERTDYESDEYMSILENFSECNERFAILGGESSEGDAVKVLKGLGFKDGDFYRKIEEFSGGWQMRVVLAKMLLQKPNYLLLDEPTNHLDIESIIWLEKFLKSYYGAIIIISHDQQFLDNCTNRTVEIELGKLHDYKANYSKYLELRKDRKEKSIAAFENQQRLIAQKEKVINRFMAKATKTKMAQSMQKQLDKMERIEVDQEDTGTMNLQFPPAPRSGQVVIDAQNVFKSYGSLQVLEDIDFRIERGERVAFVGQNGQGKTTLAKILVHKLKQTKGTVEPGHNVSIGYYAQNQAETLDGKITLLETMENHSPPEMRTRLRKILGAFMFSGEDAEKKVSVLSGGERARLALACMLLRPFNLLVLDEPTNHLDILSKEVLKDAINNYDGTLIIVSHDRQFLSGLTSKTLEFRDKKTYEYLGDVNYFLEKRELDNMREVEMHKTKSAEKPVNSGQSSSNGQNSDALSEEQKEIKKSLERKIQNIERKIDRQEEELKSLEKDMTKEGFYDSNESQRVLTLYDQKKKEMQELMESWETAQLELEEQFVQI